MPKRKILFISGTRADFGKIRPLIQALENDARFEHSLFVTGMHTLARYGFTVDEIFKTFGSARLEKGFRNVHVFMNQVHGESMDLVLANTIFGLSRYVSEYQPDMIVVHGDRVEALAGALVGSMRNILVAHIEGGELSGTIDELIRHSISKVAHLHFTANEETRDRLIQMGERRESIFTIGSPDIDIMLSDDLPDLEEVRAYYGIPFERYAVALLHPVTTNPAETRREARAMVKAMLASPHNFVVIYPNNDTGSDFILQEYECLKGHARIRIYPSLRLTSFLTLLKHADFLVGNSSAGVRETPVYGVPSINIGSRQANRFVCPSIANVAGRVPDILTAMENARAATCFEPVYHFGRGDSARHFRAALADEAVWQTPRQKQFVDIIQPLPTPQPQAEKTGPRSRRLALVK